MARKSITDVKITLPINQRDNIVLLSQSIPKVITNLKQSNFHSTYQTVYRCFYDQ